MISIVIKDILI